MVPLINLFEIAAFI